MVEPKTCQYCGKGIRSHGTKPAAAPGTVPGVLSRKTCIPCDGGKTRKATAPGDLAKCRSCQKTTRPPKTLAVDYPNTVARGSSRLCVSCWEKERRGLPYWEIDARNLEVPEISPEERISAARAVLHFGGDILILEALGLEDVYTLVR